MKKPVAAIMLSLFCLGGLTGQPANPPGSRQGGDDVVSAFVLSGPLPLTTVGSTEGYADDYDEICPYDGSTAPDVVYAFTPASSVTVDIDLCGSAFDTKLYIYENTVTPGLPYDCNDDFYLDDSCGIYVSKLEEVYLTGGNTYYLVIDGYDSSAYGDYVLTISANNAPPPCTWGEDFLCPAAAIAEGETCGNESNGGCTMLPGTENWVSIPDTGGIFCGTLWAEGGSRDTDQFELTLADTSFVILTADATRQVRFGLLSGGTGGYNGNPDCGDITSVSPDGFAGPCDPTALDLGLLAPGTYWFSVSMTADNGFPCDNHYWIEFDVLPMTCPPPVDISADNITATSASMAWTESGDATAWEYQVGLAGFTPSVTGTSTLINPKTVTGLAANTAYEFYVRSDCGSIFSEWAGPFAFTTLCDAIFTLPWAEDFEADWPPDCWLDPETADHGWSHSTYGAAKAGTGWAYGNLAGSTLSTPAIALSSNAVLSFWYRVEQESFPQAMTVSIGNDTIYEVTGMTNEFYKKIAIPLTEYTGQVVSLTFTGWTGTGGLDFGICLDEVSIRQFNTWIGNTTDWNDNGNWSTGSVPGQFDSAYIPSVPSGGNFPVIFGSINAICDHITVESGASVQVQPGNSMTIKNQ